MPKAIDETLAPDQIDDIEEEEKEYLRKIYNAYYIQMEACYTVILGSFSNNIGIIQTRFTPFLDYPNVIAKGT